MDTVAVVVPDVVVVPVANAHISEIVADMSALTVDRRGKLAAIGSKILSWAQHEGIEGTGQIVDALAMAIHLATGHDADTTLIRACVRAHAARKLANSLGCYESWAAATTDKAAQSVLDVASGKAARAAKPKPKSDLLKAIAACDRLGDGDLGLLMSHISAAIDAHMAAIDASEATATPPVAVAA